MNNVAPALRMLRSRNACLIGGVLLVAGLLIGGCNVFDSLSPSPNGVDALVADAQTALTDGNASRAVRLLERAYEKDSTDVRVRVELGNALFAERGLDLFALRSAAEHLVGTSETSSSSAAAQSLHSSKTVCTDGARPEMDADRYDVVPNDADPLRRLTERAALVKRVQRLVVAGVLERRNDALSSVRAQYRQKGLLVGAVAAVAKEVIDVHAVLDTTGSSLYLDREAEPHRALVACAETDAPLGRVHDALCALETAARRGRQWLQDRNRPSGGNQGTVLIERLQTLADVASARVGCS